MHECGRLLLIPSTVDGHIGCTHVSTVVSYAAVNSGVQISPSILGGGVVIFPEEELLGHKAGILLPFSLDVLWMTEIVAYFILVEFELV